MNRKQHHVSITFALAIAVAALAGPALTSAHEIEFGTPHYYGDCTIGSDGGNAATAHGFNTARSARRVPGDS